MMGEGRFGAGSRSSWVTEAIEEGEMAVEDEQGAERTAEADATDVALQSAADVADDDDVVEAHIWRAQS